MDNRKFENEMAELLGREAIKTRSTSWSTTSSTKWESRPTWNFKSNTRNHYSNMDEALDRIKWRIGDMDEGEKSIIKKHLERVLTRNSDGSLTYTRTNSKWVLIWWEKSHPS